MLQVSCRELCVLVEIDLLGDGLDISSLRHSLHEEQTGDDESYLDSDGEVEDDGEEEGDEQDGMP